MIGRIKIFFLLIFIFAFDIVSFANTMTCETGNPYIKNIPPRIYRQESQNFSVVKADNGIMYFGNLNGIMEYDNKNWNLIPLFGKPVMCKNSNGDIFFGAYDRFGKITYKNGESIPKFITETIDEQELKLGNVNNIIAFDDIVFFTNNNTLFSYSFDELNIEIKNVPGIKIFDVNNSLYVYVPQSGIYQKTGTTYSRVEQFRGLKDIEISDLIYYEEGKILIKPKHQKGFIIFRNDSLVKFNTEADEFIQNYRYSTAKILPDKSIMIGTEQGGVVVINENGEYLFAVNNENGLNDNFITDIYFSESNIVWLTTYNGITMLQTPSAFSYFDKTSGINGAILSIARNNNQIYVATTFGVFKYKYKCFAENQRNIAQSNIRFHKVSGINSRIWSLNHINDNFYAAGEEGLYVIDGKITEKIIDGSFYFVDKSKFHDNIAFVGSVNGLLVGEILDDNILISGFISDLQYGIRTLSEESDSIIWLGTSEEGAIKLNFDTNNILNSKFEKFNETNAFHKGFNWVDVYSTKKGTIFSTQNGVYRYNYQDNSFSFDNKISFNFSNKNKYLYPVIEDRDFNLWFSSGEKGEFYRETGVAEFNIEKNMYLKHTSRFAQIREFQIESIFVDSSSVWFGSTESLIKFDKTFDFESARDNNVCLIRKVTIGQDSVIKLNPDYFYFDDEVITKYANNRIRFDYTSLNYDMYGYNEFRYMLEGFDDDWSSWTKSTYKEYTSLKEGDYTFMVMSRDIYGNESNIVSIDVRITPPIYRTVFAYFLYVVVFGVFITLVIKFNELRYAKDKHRLEKLVEQRTNELASQKEQTEMLVKKLLPFDTAHELQQSGSAKSKQYELVSVLFADIKGFTQIAGPVQPDKLLNYLNKLFSSFDEVIGKYNIQKIKTIGDAYMCTGGMPDSDKTNPVETVLAGLQIQEKVSRFRKRNKLAFHVRVGIHSGPVVAGVIGVKKLEYDIWGDTVNIASRMESNGIVDKVNVSETTYQLVQEFFECELRANVPIKYKGEVDMYTVHRIKPELASGGSAIIPNRRFFIKLQHLRFKVIQEEILSKMEESLPKNLYYHNLKHTTNVLHTVEYIATEEKVSEEELLLLKCAALFHDAGFMVSYDNNEIIGADMAEQTLKRYKFTDEQIKTVKRLIMATQLPPQPKDHLEEIICDADLDYLGRPDFIPISQNLFRELFERGKINTITEWNKMQYKFMLNHNFYTKTAQKKRNKIKETVLKELESLI